MNAIMEKRSKKFAVNYYQLLSQEKREELRGCIAKLHGELESRRRAFEELERITDKIDDLMTAPNQLTREISTDDEYESPRHRDKRARTRTGAVMPAITQAPAPSGSWLPFSFGGSTAAPLSLSNPASTQAKV